MTYGKLRLAIQKENVGADLELLDGYIQGRYTEILDGLAWKRQEAETVIQAPASYATGTVTATQGSTNITGVGTTWTDDMTGLMIRVDSQEEYYQFTFVDATHATIDRGYEQPDGAGLTYRVDQAVFLLSADCRILRNVKPLHFGGRPLKRMTPGELDAYAPQRTTYGTPEIYAPTWDSFSDPPQMQVELYPIPDVPDSNGALLSWVADYIFEQPDITPGSTASSLLPWVRPAALKAGVKADVLRLAENYTGAAEYEKRFEELVVIMAKNNAYQRGAQEIRVDPAYGRRDRNFSTSWPVNRPWDGE